MTSVAVISNNRLEVGVFGLLPLLFVVDGLLGSISTGFKEEELLYVLLLLFCFDWESFVIFDLAEGLGGGGAEGFESLLGLCLISFGYFLEDPGPTISSYEGGKSWAS